MLDSVARESSAAWRSLVKRPGSTLAAILTLALGLGATTALFTVIHGVLLRPLDLRDSQDLVWLWGQHKERGALFERTSEADLVEWREHQTSFEALVGAHNRALTWGGREDPLKLSALVTTSDFLQILGVQPVAGRVFQEGDEGQALVVATHRLWGSHFASAEDAVGQTLVLDGAPHTIIGALPASFVLPRGGADVYLTRNLRSGLRRNFRSFWVLGRLAPGVDLARAQGEMAAFAERAVEKFPDSHRGWSVQVVPLEDHLVRDVKGGLWILFGAVGLLLLIACANVAHLLLLKSQDRRQEIAVRRALGAGPWQVTLSSLIEGGFLALGGSVLGLGIAWYAVPWLLSFEPGFLPRRTEIGVDFQVFGFSALLAVLTALLCSVGPALRSLAFHPVHDLGTSRSTGPTRQRNLLVSGEVAFTLLLLAGAALLLRSFESLRQVDPGFDPEGVAVVRVFPKVGSLSLPERVELFNALEDRLRSVPGVETVGAGTNLPLSRIGLPLTSSYALPGHQRAHQEEAPEVDVALVTPGYLPTLEVPILRGRGLLDSDQGQGQPVMVINEALARRAFPAGDALGKTLHLSLDDGVEREVVGVVGDIRFTDLVRDPRPTAYLPITQHRMWSGLTLVVQTSADPAALLPTLRREILAQAPDQPPHSLTTLPQLLDEALGLERFAALLLGLFAGLALILSVVGVYAVVSASVGRRLREMGLRRALGARRRQVHSFVLRQAMGPVARGLLLGTILAWPLGRNLEILLHGVRLWHPATWITTAGVLTLGAFLAAWTPAHRASRVDPAVALKSEG